MVLPQRPLLHSPHPILRHPFLKALNPRLENLHHHSLSQHLLLHLPKHLLPNRRYGRFTLAHVLITHRRVYADSHKC